jgi:hypothetical protein
VVGVHLGKRLHGALFCPLFAFYHHHLIPLHALVCYFCFTILAFFFSPLAPSLSLSFRYLTFLLLPPISSRFIVSGIVFLSERLNTRCCIFQTVIPLYILLVFLFSYLLFFFIKIFPTRAGNGIFATYLTLLQLLNPFLYASTRRSLYGGEGWHRFVSKKSKSRHIDPNGLEEH